MPGIFRWVVEGLRRLRCRDRFTEPTLCREALDIYRTESNPARAFLQGSVVADPRSFVECQVLYWRYRSWSEANGYWPLNAAQLGLEVRRVYPSVVRKKVASLDEAGKRVWAYAGVTLT